MRFHVLGLSHTRTSREYSVCAFTQKARNLCRMLYDRGHTVYHYGVEGSDPVCTEHVSVVDSATFERVHGAHDYRREGFLLNRKNDAYRAFTAGAVKAIAARFSPGDFLLCTFGLDHQPIAEALPGLIAVESGIGYDHTFARWRVWESYAWMHHAYGKEGRGLSPSWYDAVIPNGYDLADFPYQPDRGDYHIFLGRPTPLKGFAVARDVCAELAVQLYAAGQGSPNDFPGATHLGVLGPEARADWVGHAAALWAPTQYMEPFGGVAVEAALLGTPVICTDWGAFPETVIHGHTGYRCRTYAQFVYAARHTGQISPADCRAWAEATFSLARVGGLYESYFADLAALHRSPAGWYAREGVA